MKHTKNILKSLLITVMALSLLAVSCKKDEGGSKPTAPTTTKITASDLTQVLNAIDIKDTISFTGVSPVSGKASVTAKTDTYDTLKSALDKVLATEQEQVKVVAAYGAKDTTKKTFDLTLTITAKAGYVLDDKMTEYTYTPSDKTAKLVITITAANSANWK